jgi:hypothetical protein
MTYLTECSALRRLAKNPADANVERTGTSWFKGVQAGLAQAAADIASVRDKTRTIFLM